MGESEEVAARVEREGFAVVSAVMGEREIARALSALERAERSPAPARRLRRGGNDGNSGVYAVRNLLDAVPELRELIDATRAPALAAQVLGAPAFVVRSILFDKTPEANWKVAWHQDFSIAVRARRDAEGFGAWSEKAGVMHVQPPAAILERMLTVRLHLDAGDEANAPLRVIPGSHSRGRLDAAAIAHLRETSTVVACLVPRGGALLMRPLLLHASSASREPERRRRVVHLEFAAGELPAGLEWASGASGAER
ncbi:MAG TPA: phytanoyl-CoA dioxygenase family protein [Pyrinomonadaceae bacterium]|jgi:ectoine hydroxylase-related dioxygenase (phytanoyl-CoA dioxygenase family)